jgi:hypothetical protein
MLCKKRMMLRPAACNGHISAADDAAKHVEPFLDSLEVDLN